MAQATQVLDLEEIIRDLCAVGVAAGGARGWRLMAELPDTLAPLAADADRMRPLLDHLLRLVLGSGGNGPLVFRVCVHPSTRRVVRIDVDGSGAPAIEPPPHALAELTHLMSSAQQLAREVDADLRPRVQAGRAYTFSLIFPRAASYVPPPAPPPPPARRPERRVLITPRSPPKAPPGTASTPVVLAKRVLIIDDDADVRALATRFLGRLGCAALAAAGGDEGMALAARERPHLVLLDIMMPDKDGWQTLAEMKKNPAIAGIPVLICSCVVDEARAAALGAVGILPKPIARDRLEQAIRQHAARDDA